MAIFVNMDKNLIRHGKRKAPAMSESQFRVLLQKFFDEEHFDEDVLDGEGLDEALSDVMYDICYADPTPGFTKLYNDFEKVNVDRENFDFQGIIMTDTGIPVIMSQMGGDWEIPVISFVYYDGKDFRGYVPIYGNSFNIYAETAFGSEERSAKDYFDKPYTFYREKETDMFSENSAVDKLLPLRQTAAITLTEDIYRSIEWYKCIEANEVACIEDFTAYVAVSGYIPDDKDVVAQLKEFQAQKEAEERQALIEKQKQMSPYLGLVYRNQLIHEDDKILSSAGPSNFCLEIDGANFFIIPINGQPEEGADDLILQEIPMLERLDRKHYFEYSGCILEALGHDNTNAVLKAFGIEANMTPPADSMMLRSIELVLLSTDKVRLVLSELPSDWF